jgi:hypothetical protein
VALILVPSPVKRSQNHPISGSIERVDTKSSQKKNVKKYYCLQRLPTKISMKNKKKQTVVMPKKI